MLLFKEFDKMVVDTGKVSRSMTVVQVTLNHEQCTPACQTWKDKKKGQTK